MRILNGDRMRCKVEIGMRLRVTLATLLVVMLLSGSYVSSACGAACAVEDFHSAGSSQSHTSSASRSAEITCKHDHPLDGGAIQPNSSAVFATNSAACDDHDCDAAPAVVQSSDTLKRDGSSNADVSVVYQARVGSEADRISLQMPLLQDTSPPSRKTILRI